MQGREALFAKINETVSSMSGSSAKSASKDTYCFYGSEILGDFQIRSRIVSKKKESVPKDVPNRIGMPSIKPSSKVGKYFVNFASSSTVHGLNHLVAPNRHPIERFLAALFIIGALVCLIFLSFLFWDRYQNNATVIVVDNNRDQLNILKPALFICPMPNVDSDKFPVVFEKHDIRHTPEAEEFFTFLASATYEDMTNAPLFNQVPADKWIEILHDLRQDIPSNVLKENDPCETWVATERGLCFATRSPFAYYNSLSYWANKNLTAVPSSDNLPYYDQNADGTQEYVGVPNTALIGAYDPFEMILYDSPMKWIKPRMLQRSVLSMSAIKTKPNVQELAVRQRKCKFFSDGGLKTWPVYSRSMCVIECRMNVIQEYCKCRPHFTIPIMGVNICNATQLRCIGRITEKLFLYKYPPSHCECIPKCDVVSYQIRDNEKKDTPITSSVMTLVVELPPVIYYRSLLYGFTDFLTGVGGAAGLFLGASVLSFVEIFYYATLHLYCCVKRETPVQK